MDHFHDQAQGNQGAQRRAQYTADLVHELIIGNDANFSLARTPRGRSSWPARTKLTPGMPSPARDGEHDRACHHSPMGLAVAAVVQARSHEGLVHVHRPRRHGSSPIRSFEPKTMLFEEPVSARRGVFRSGGGWEQERERDTREGHAGLSSQDGGDKADRMDLLEASLRRLALVVDTQGYLLRSLQVTPHLRSWSHDVCVFVCV